jgi:hypothetical protein
MVGSPVGQMWESSELGVATSFSVVLAERIGGVGEDKRFRTRAGTHVCCGSEEQLYTRPGRVSGITTSPRCASHRLPRMFRR